MPPVLRSNSKNSETMSQTDAEGRNEVIEAETISQFSSRPNIQFFKGDQDKVSIENWLKRYNQIATFYKWTDDMKSIMPGNYLKDDALNYYIELPDQIPWEEVVLKMSNRFGICTTEPIVEFVHTIYDPKKGLKDYFERKRRLGFLSNLTEKQMIPLFIDALPPYLSVVFGGFKPLSLDAFYEAASRAETNNHRKYKTNEAPKQAISKSMTNTKINGKKKPPGACRICEELGYPGRMHWVNDCFNKGKQKSTKVERPSKTVNIIEKTASEENLNLNF